MDKQTVSASLNNNNDPLDYQLYALTARLRGMAANGKADCQALAKRARVRGLLDADFRPRLGPDCLPLNQQTLSMSLNKQKNKYSYQDGVIKKVVEDLLAGHNPLVIMPTGTGKSHILWGASRVIAGNHGWRVLCLTNKLTLLNQDYGCAYSNNRENLRIRKYHGENKELDPEDQIVYSTTQTMLARLDKQDSDRNLWFDMVAFDEAHHTSFPPEYEAQCKLDSWPKDDADKTAKRYGQLYHRLREINPGVRFMGLTATAGRKVPSRGGMVSICRKHGDTVFDTISVDMTDEDSVKMFEQNGILVPITCYDHMHLPLERLDVEEYIQFGNDGVVLYAADFAKSLAKSMAGSDCCKNPHASILLVLQNRRTAQEAADCLMDQGIKATAVYSGMKKGQIEDALDKFRKGEIKCLVSVNMLSEGFDAPRANVLIIGVSIQSPIKFYQMLGRVRRCCGETNKDSGILIDLACNLTDKSGTFVKFDPKRPFSSYLRKLDRPLTEADFLPGGPKEAQGHVCPECGSPIPPTELKKCPFCSYEFPDQEADAAPEFGYEQCTEALHERYTEVLIDEPEYRHVQHYDAVVTNIACTTCFRNEKEWSVKIELEIELTNEIKIKVFECFDSNQGLTERLRCFLRATRQYEPDSGHANKVDWQGLWCADDLPVKPLAIRYRVSGNSRIVTGYRMPIE